MTFLTIVLLVNTRTERGGGRFCPPLMFLWISFEIFVRSPWFFQYLPKNKRRTFWCKNWRLVDFWGSIFKPPKSALPFFAELMPWRGCPGAPSRRPVARGAAGRWGVPAERLGGGGGARSRSRIAGSGGRASLRPAATGRVADGETAAGQWRRMKGQGQYTYMCDTSPWKSKCECASRYYYSNYVLE